MTRTPLIAAFLGAALVLTACGGDGGDDTAEAAAPTTRSVTADNGTVQVPAAPQRVATIGNTTQPYIDLGGKPVAVTQVVESTLTKLPADQQATYKAATNVGDQEIDLEKLAGLKPDLILVQIDDAGFKAIEKQLTSIAPTVSWSLDTEWKEFADAISEAGNTSAALSQQKTQFAEKVAKIKETYGAVIKDTTFVDIARAEWSDPGTFYIADIGCSEIARDDIGLNLPEAAAGQDPLAYANLPYEQLTSLSKYDVITYPVTAAGQPTVPFAEVANLNTWKALPAVTSGRALGVFCPGNNSYGPVLQYLDSLDKALATLPAKE
ncbi:ABC transporter substrate-binding protein [Actinoplanes sp. Pm04-4]|uniref:ABC transporter substrate-binding protein n=1 Tax=Paractinoplanes pyxinae TaxID=2997416 RepID=A0ABT4BCR3_9ACTN|nr:ABC transporter substrate-binding protein [Actinoplanes pyxinae]MCY1143605.1 ABC transporter substrate-binding protein [Actinoplanes pyxinae]